MDVARAFQPEICPVRLERQVFAALVLVPCRLFGLREAAKAGGQLPTFFWQRMNADVHG